MVRVWGKEDVGCARADARPRYASPSEVKCTQHRTGAQIQGFGLSVFTIEASFLLSHCMTVEVICATSHAVWLRLSFRPRLKFHTARLPPEWSLSSLAPRLMTPLLQPCSDLSVALVLACFKGHHHLMHSPTSSERISRASEFMRPNYTVCYVTKQTQNTTLPFSQLCGNLTKGWAIPSLGCMLSVTAHNSHIRYIYSLL